MWKYTKEDLENIEVRTNYVLVKLPRGNDEVVINKGEVGETKLFLPINVGNQEVHAPVFGEVIAVCEEVHKAGSNDLIVDEVEIQVGDKALFYYLDVVEALGGYTEHDSSSKERLIIVDGDAYVLMPYSAFYCVLRNDEIIAVNGYVIGTSVERPEMKVNGLVIGVDANDNRIDEMKYYDQQMMVKYVGNPCVHRYAEGMGDEHLDTVDIEPGSLVHLLKDSFMCPLEVDIHAVLDENLYYVQRRFITSVLSAPVEEESRYFVSSD